MFMKSILYMITLVLVFSFKAQKDTQERIFGAYETKTEGVSGKIILNKDSSFTYQYNAGLINTSSKGTWKFTDKTLVLKSDEEYLTNEIKVKEYVQKNNHQLIETLIENIAEILLKDFNIEYVTISISKPGAIRDSQDVGIEITRKKNSST